MKYRHICLLLSFILFDLRRHELVPKGNLVNETPFYIIRALYSIIYSYPLPARAKTVSDAPRAKNGMDAIGERGSSVASLVL